MDSLRAIAAISVFFAHGLVLLEYLGGNSLSPLLARQDIGVAIFLMISAFLLYRPFVQARYERPADAADSSRSRSGACCGSSPRTGWR